MFFSRTRPRSTSNRDVTSRSSFRFLLVWYNTASIRSSYLEKKLELRSMQIHVRHSSLCIIFGIISLLILVKQSHNSRYNIFPIDENTKHLPRSDNNRQSYYHSNKNSTNNERTYGAQQWYRTIWNQTIFALESIFPFIAKNDSLCSTIARISTSRNITRSRSSPVHPISVHKEVSEHHENNRSILSRIRRDSTIKNDTNIIVREYSHNISTSSATSVSFQKLSRRKRKLKNKIKIKWLHHDADTTSDISSRILSSSSTTGL
jgi:hypothetical protein